MNLKNKKLVKNKRNQNFKLSTIILNVKNDKFLNYYLINCKIFERFGK